MHENNFLNCSYPQIGIIKPVSISVFPNLTYRVSTITAKSFLVYSVNDDSQILLLTWEGNDTGYFKTTPKRSKDRGLAA